MTAAVILFSKFNKLFLGYFDPVNLLFLIIKMDVFWGDLKEKRENTALQVELVRLSALLTTNKKVQDIDVLHLYQNSADMGHAGAATIVGDLLNQGSAGTPRDHAKAFEYFKQAAAAGAPFLPLFAYRSAATDALNHRFQNSRVATGVNYL